jgi:hypothetical protein
MKHQNPNNPLTTVESIEHAQRLLESLRKSFIHADSMPELDALENVIALADAAAASFALKMKRNREACDVLYDASYDLQRSKGAEEGEQADVLMV